MGVWNVITPVQSQNQVLNPVAMGAGNFGVVGANTTHTVVTNYSYLGYKCYRINTTVGTLYAGGYYTLSALANIVHYVTVRVRGTLPGTWVWTLNGGTNYRTPTLLFREGDWYTYGYQFPFGDCNGSTQLRLVTGVTTTQDIYVGHVQVEPLAYPTTPITGDIRGFTKTGYYWAGNAHESPSVRTANERHGGSLTDLENDCKYRVTYGQGSGMPPIEHHAIPMALLPGSIFQGYKVLPRVLDLISVTIGKTTAEVASARKKFIENTKLDLVTPIQPVVFRYTGTNNNRPIDYHCYYDSGLEFQISKGIIDTATPRFIAYDPLAYEQIQGGVTLPSWIQLGNSQGFAYKYFGIWNAYSSMGGYDYTTIVEGNDGLIYTPKNSTAPGSIYLTQYNPFTKTVATWGTTGTGSVLGCIKAPNGDIIVFGGFTACGGVTTNDIVRYVWSSKTWAAIGAPSGSGTIYCACYDKDGYLWVGGSFVDWGDTSGDYIKYWNGSAWVSVGTGMNGYVHSLYCDDTGKIWAGGRFTTGNGVTLNGIGYYDKTLGTWVAIGGSTKGVAGGTVFVESLTGDTLGNIYLAGEFTSAAGDSSIKYVGMWNGSMFLALGSGIDARGFYLYYNKKTGLLHVNGAFDYAGGRLCINGYACWNGATWLHLDILQAYPTYSNGFLGILETENAIYYTGSASIAYTPGYTSVLNAGSTVAYPKITITRSGGTYAAIWYIANETTGDVLYMDYPMADNETIEIEFASGIKSIKSNVYGDVMNAILRPSKFASFNLQPGYNNIHVYVVPQGTPTVTAYMTWTTTHWGADMVAI